jgi:SMC interacting uncharacterized protein involved in chromosome segregation
MDIYDRYHELKDNYDSLKKIITNQKVTIERLEEERIRLEKEVYALNDTLEEYKG